MEQPVFRREGIYARTRRGLEAFDNRFILFMRANGVLLLRVSLGTVFIWFGLLKVFDVSPVEDLVAATVYWIPPGPFVPLLGAWETTVGILLLLGRLPRIALLLFWLLLAGTFLVFLLRPDIAFQEGNPLLLTTEGEFVAKNLVLICAGIVVGSTVRRLRPAGPGPRLERKLGQGAA